MAEALNESTSLLHDDQHVRFDSEIGRPGNRSNFYEIGGDATGDGNNDVDGNDADGNEGATDAAENSIGNVDDASNAGGNKDGGKKDQKAKKKKKKKGVRLTYQTALALESQVHMNLIKHGLAADYFAWQQYWKFSFPQATLTALSSTLAFSASAEMFKGHADIINLIVGFNSAIVVLIQTISGLRNFGTRSDRHRSTAVQLRDLVDDISLMKFKLNMVEKLTMQNYDSLRTKAAERRSQIMGTIDTNLMVDWDESEEHKENEEEEEDNEEHADLFDSIQKRYQQALSGCSSNVPMELSEAFHGLASNLEIAETKDNNERLHKIYGHFNYRSVLHAKAYDVMAGEILNDFWFPAKLPDSKQMVKQSMKVLKERLHKSTALYEGLDVPYQKKKPRFQAFSSWMTQPQPQPIISPTTRKNTEDSFHTDLEHHV